MVRDKRAKSSAQRARCKYLFPSTHLLLPCLAVAFSEGGLWLAEVHEDVGGLFGFTTSKASLANQQLVVNIK